jgi:sRNA-binding carbon storage regulator CsrA
MKITVAVLKALKLGVHIGVHQPREVSILVSNSGISQHIQMSLSIRITI